MEFDRHLSAGGLEWSWNIIAAELLRKSLVGDFDIVITAASIELNVKCFKSELNHESLRSLQLPLLKNINVIFFKLNIFIPLHSHWDNFQDSLVTQ